MATKLSTVMPIILHLRKPTTKEQRELIGEQCSPTLLLCDASDKVVAQIEVNDLFDHEGNRFEVDIEL